MFLVCWYIIKSGVIIVRFFSTTGPYPLKDLKECKFWATEPFLVMARTMARRRHRIPSFPGTCLQAQFMLIAYIADD